MAGRRREQQGRERVGGRRNRTAGLAAALALGAALACGAGEGDGADPGDGPEPWGTWLLESGSAMPGFLGTLTSPGGDTTDVTALTLRDDGTGRVFLRDRWTGAKDCVRAAVIFDGETLVLDLAAAEPDVASNFTVVEHAFAFPVVDATTQSLGLADAEGRIALFSRREQLPDSVTCRTLEVLDRFDGLPRPYSLGDLVLFEDDLVYNSVAEDMIEVFDLDVDALSEPLAPSSRRIVQTSQLDTLWTHCSCGAVDVATQRTRVKLLDSVDTDADLRKRGLIRAIAYVSATDQLWLHVQPYSGDRAQLLAVSTRGEPDRIEDSLDFDRPIRGMTFDGVDLWALVTVAARVVARIDLETGDVLETFEVPDEDVFWSGIEVVDGELYLLGANADREGVLTRLVLP